MKPNRHHRVWTARPAIALLVSLVASDVDAAALSWRTAVSGNAGIAANWLPSQVPAPADVLTFHVGGAYTVTFDGTVPLSATQLYRSGTVTVVGGTHSLSTQLRVGDVNGDVGIMALTTGTMTSAGNVVVGNAAGSVGTLHVDDDDADLLQSGSSDVLVGNSGQGTLNVTGGGLVTAADKVIVGGSSAGQGSVLVSGVNVAPVVRSKLASSGADGDLVFGNGGTATVVIAGGAQAVASDDVFIAQTASSNGSVFVDGTGGGFTSQLTVGDDLGIATNTLAGPAAGVGTLVVQQQGQVLVTGSANVGEADGGTGTLRLRTGSLFSAHDLVFDNVHGVLDQQGGSIIVDGGVFDPPGTTLLLSDPSFERVTLKNGATAAFDGGSSVGYALVLGESSEGGFALESGAHLTQVNGVLSLGLAPGGHGVLDVSTNALLDGAGSIIVGQSGFGELSLFNGGEVDLTDMSVAYAPGSNGFVSMGTAGAVLTLGKLDIGGHGLTAGGTASVVVGNGGSIVLDGSEVVPLRLVHPGARLQVDAGGTVSGSANFDTRGHIQMNGGQLTIGSVNFLDTADLVGHGTVSAEIATSSAPNSVIHASGGPLVLGLSSSVKGFVGGGTLIADGGAPVTLRDADLVTLGNVILNGGGVNLPSGGGSLLSGKTLSGNGAVIGTLANAGTIAPGNSSWGLLQFTSLANTGIGRFTLEIGNAATNHYDRLAVSGLASLAGALDVKILPGFVPDDGEDFTLITCGSRSGTFSSVTIEGLPVNMQFNLVYNPTSVVLHVNHITTDVPPAADLPHSIALVGRSGSWGNAGVELALPDAARVVVRLYDVSGRERGTLFEGELPAGRRWLPLREVTPAPADGVHFARAVVRTGTVATRHTAKVTLVK